MWKLLYAVIVVAVLSTYADADHERGKYAIRNRKIHIQNLQPPIDYSVKGQEAIVIESEFLGYNYSTPKTKTDGYVYTPGYIYVTPPDKISTITRKPTVRTTKPSTPGTTYLPPGTTYLPPTTTSTTTTTTSTTTPTTTTTTSTTTPTTITTTSTTTPSTTPFKRITYLPPPEPPKVYLPVRAPVMPYPPVIYNRTTTEKTITRVNPSPITIPPPTPPKPTSPRPTGYYLEYLPPKEYLPAFITRK